MRQTEVAVVGVGSLGVHHARVYSEMSSARLVAVVDTQKDRAAQVAERFGCLAVERAEELPPEVQAVSLAVPTILHAEIGTFLLEKGIHVLVEKPIASALEEADALIEASRRSGSILQVGHIERFNPAFQAVKALIRAPQFFETHRLGVFVRRSLDVDVVLDLMIHDLDLILHLIGQPVHEVRAVGIPVLTPRVDIASARIEFESGCVANVTASRVSREKIRKLRLFQPHDYISIDFHGKSAEVHSLLDDEQGRRVEDRSPEVDSTEPLFSELECFVKTVHGLPAVQPPCTGTEAREALELALEILRQIDQKLASTPTTSGEDR